MDESKKDGPLVQSFTRKENMKAPYTREALHALSDEAVEVLAEQAGEIWAELASGFYAGDADEDRLRFWAAQIQGESSRRIHERIRAAR